MINVHHLARLAMAQRMPTVYHALRIKFYIMVNALLNVLLELMEILLALLAQLNAKLVIKMDVTHANQDF